MIQLQRKGLGMKILDASNFQLWKVGVLPVIRFACSHPKVFLVLLFHIAKSNEKKHCTKSQQICLHNRHCLWSRNLQNNADCSINDKKIHDKQTSKTNTRPNTLHASMQIWLFLRKRHIKVDHITLRHRNTWYFGEDSSNFNLLRLQKVPSASLGSQKLRSVRILVVPWRIHMGLVYLPTFTQKKSTKCW